MRHARREKRRYDNGLFRALTAWSWAARCGAIDPGVLLYFVLERGIAGEALQHMLYEESRGCLEYPASRATCARWKRATTPMPAKR